MYSRAEIEGAESSRTLQALIGWPFDQEFKEALSSPGTLYNSHLTADDATRELEIFVLQLCFHLIRWLFISFIMSLLCCFVLLRLRKF